MAPPLTTKQRLERIEATITPVLVEISALVVVFKLLLDFDFGRCEDGGGEPFRFVMEEELDEQLAIIDMESAEDDVWMLAATLLAAHRIVAEEQVEIESEPDDDASQH